LWVTAVQSHPAVVPCRSVELAGVTSVHPALPVAGVIPVVPAAVVALADLSGEIAGRSVVRHGSFSCPAAVCPGCRTCVAVCRCAHGELLVHGSVEPGAGLPAGVGWCCPAPVVMPGAPVCVVVARS